MSRFAGRVLIEAVRRLLGIRVRGVPPTSPGGPRVFFANHESHLDTLAILAALPPAVRDATRPTGALDYWSANRLRRFVAVTCLRAVLVRRDRVPDVDPLADVAAALGEGACVILFPEGTRGGGGVAPFRAGLHRLARLYPTAELVPVHLDNTGRAMPKGALLAIPLRPTVTFGPLLSRRDAEECGAFLARARAAVASLSPRLEQPA